MHQACNWQFKWCICQMLCNPPSPINPDRQNRCSVLNTALMECVWVKRASMKCGVTMRHPALCHLKIMYQYICWLVQWSFYNLYFVIIVTALSDSYHTPLNHMTVNLCSSLHLRPQAHDCACHCARWSRYCTKMIQKLTLEPEKKKVHFTKYHRFKSCLCYSLKL